MNDSLNHQQIIDLQKQAIDQSNYYIVIAYIIYIIIAIALTTYVSRKLFQSGKIFMMDIFNQREEIAFSTNRLFELGFYLLNIGFALRILQIYSIDNKKEFIEKLSYKIGFFAIYLGVMLFINLFLFFRGKRIAAAKRALNPTN